MIATVTGTLNPDATGRYFMGGQYNSKPYYLREDGYAIYDAAGTYVISDSLGGGGKWSGGATVAGVYTPVGAETGNATVAVSSRPSADGPNTSTSRRGLTPGVRP